MLAAIEHHITPAMTRAAARRAVEIIREQNATTPTKAKRLREELATAEAEAKRYVAAIGKGAGKLESVLTALAAAEARCEALRRELSEMESSPLLDALSGDEQLERELAERAAEWHEVLKGDVPIARQALRSLLATPVLFRPDGNGYRLSGATKLAALFPEKTLIKMASPRGLSAFISGLRLPISGVAVAA